MPDLVGKPMDFAKASLRTRLAQTTIRSASYVVTETTEASDIGGHYEPAKIETVSTRPQSMELGRYRPTADWDHIVTGQEPSPGTTLTPSSRIILTPGPHPGPVKVAWGSRHFEAVKQLGTDACFDCHKPTQCANCHVYIDQLQQ